MNTPTDPDNIGDSDDVPAEVDFSDAEIGRFYRPKAVFQLPVYLEPEVRAWLSDKAASKGVTLEDIANELLRREIDLIEAMK